MNGKITASLDPAPEVSNGGTGDVMLNQVQISSDGANFYPYGMILQGQKFPYDVPAGTRHLVLWIFSPQATINDAGLAPPETPTSTPTYIDQ